MSKWLKIVTCCQLALLDSQFVFMKRQFVVNVCGEP